MRDFQAPGRSLVYAGNGMCAASHPLAAQVAVRMLQDGGNAVDAAIAAAVLLGFSEPPHAARRRLLRAAEAAGEERLVGLNGSGPRAGRRSTPRRCAPHGHRRDADRSARGGHGAGRRRRLRAGSPPTGAGSVSPRASRRRSGYAEAGVPVAPRTARDWRPAAPTLAGDGAAALPARRRGAAPRATSSARPARREVLRRIARDGRDGFYDGEVAEDMVASLRALGGAAHLDDFAAHRLPTYVEPIAGGYRGHELVELPPNGQGATAILMAKILARLRPRPPRPAGAARAHSRPRRPSSPTTPATASSADPGAGAAAARAHARRRHRRAARRADRPARALRTRPRRAERSTATRSISASSTATGWRCR